MASILTPFQRMIPKFRAFSQLGKMHQTGDLIGRLRRFAKVWAEERHALK